MISKKTHERTSPFHSLEEKVSFPVVSPFPNFPFITLLSPDGNLHSSSMNIEKRSKSKKHTYKVEIKFLVIHKSHDISISLSQQLLISTSDSNDSIMLSIK